MLKSIYDNHGQPKRKCSKREDKSHSRSPNGSGHQKYSLDELDDYLQVERDAQRIGTIQQNTQDEPHVPEVVESQDLSNGEPKTYLTGDGYDDDDDDIEMVLDSVENNEQQDFINIIPINNQTEEFISIDGSQSQIPTCFVIDTNFIISHLEILENLRSLFTQYHHTIIIPRYTIRELDGLKGSDRVIENNECGTSTNRHKSVGEAARAANTWIYSHLANTSSGVIGQKLSQRININSIKDDSILDCCLYFKERKNCFVILLSNDKNLCLKALTEEVLTVSYRTGMTGELIARIAYDERNYRFGSTTEELSHPSTSVSGQDVSVGRHMDSARPPFSEISARIFEDVTVMVIESTKRIMLDEYGDTVEFLDFNSNSLHSLVDVSKCIYTYWVSVFSEYFRGSNLIKESWKDLPVALTSLPTQNETLHIFQQFWCDILEHLFIKSNVVDQEKLLTKLEGWERLIANII